MSIQKIIQNRIEKNYKHRLKWAKRENIEAFRIYEKDIPEFPIIVDVYGPYAVVFLKGDDEIDAEKPEHLNYALAAVKNVLNIPEANLIIKARLRQKDGQYEKLAQKEEYISVKEHQASFLVNLNDYLDTGLFLDHRPMRQIIYKESKGKKVLNLFSYTGSVSVMAAIGGATHVTSVDMSQTYQEWARRNFTHNNLSLKEHNFIVQSAMEYLEKANTKFDLIFLDPPTFSNSKKLVEDFEVEKDHVNLIKQCLKILSTDGVLYFSNNKRKFKLDPIVHTLARVEDISLKTIPQDFRDPKIHHCYRITHVS
jgi:23S rRNA (cytosine1962-C5)-methyltransferase/23S rRNA (guanine2445-N2)-methyltransferase / 23S rRNA (guanine2069-N7)-methyltransferase